MVAAFNRLMSCLEGADLSRPNILTIAASLAPAEYSACVQCVAAYDAFLPYIPALVIDAIFVANAPLWFETRRAAWESNFVMEREEVTVDDVPITVYRVNNQWVSDLSAAMQGGTIIPPDCTAIRRFP